MTAATLEQARAAKKKLRERLAGHPDLRGIGIATLMGGYGVKVNLLSPPQPGIVPDDVDGVPVIIDVVGVIGAS
jgi:hypothetical protein